MHDIVFCGKKARAGTFTFHEEEGVHEGGEFRNEEYRCKNNLGIGKRKFFFEIFAHRMNENE